MILGLLLARIVDLVSLLVLIRCILSWVRVDPYNPMIRLLYQVTDPLLKPFQAFTVRSGGVGIDFAPVVVLVLLQLLRNFLLRTF